jgi:hypothetical protein
MSQFAKINPNISKIPPAIYDQIPRHLIPEMITLSLEGNSIDLEILEQDGTRETDIQLTEKFQKNYPNLSSYFQFNKPLKIYSYKGCWWPNWLFIEKIKVEEQKPPLSIY